MLTVRERKGFTLIELLVVIAIIAILAAILLPVFLSARQRARMSACQSNMRQIASAMQSYVSDWNGYLAMGHRGPSWDRSVEDCYWGEAIRRYCGNKRDVCYCPGLPPRVGYLPGQGDPDDAPMGWNYYWGTTIGMNVALGQEGQGTAVPPCRADSLPAPSRVILFGDSSEYRYTAYWKSQAKVTGSWAIFPGRASDAEVAKITIGGGVDAPVNPFPAGWPYDVFDPERHSGKINIACVDGHVVAKDRLWLLRPHASDPNDANYTWWDRR